MTKFLSFLLFFLGLFSSPICQFSGAAETVDVEKGEVSAVEKGRGATEFADGENPGKLTRSEAATNSLADFSGYPKTFIIPKGVCEQSVPVMTIEE